MVDRLKKWKWWMFGIILLGGLTAYYNLVTSRKEHSQDSYILAAAQTYAMDPALIKAVVWRESRFDPRARGGKGEIGLMQIGKLAAQEWAAAEHVASFRHEQLFDPALNTMAGTWYLRKVMRRYTGTDNPLRYALADYNAGRAQVLRWNKGAASTNSVLFLQQIDYPSTRRYVESIIKKYSKYRRELPSPPG
jgi:peptidoglycan lytic transglycosylase